MINDGNKISTIIVDDEDPGIWQLEKYIKLDAAFEIVATCKNAAEALNAINKYHPNVAFLDIAMPNMTGIEMIEMLNENNMPRVVFVTGRDEDATKAFELGAIDYIFKPVDERVLNLTLARLKVDCTPIDLDKIQNVLKPLLPSEPVFIDAFYAGNNVRIRLSDIIFATTKDAHGIDLIIKDEDVKYHYKGTLAQLAEYKEMRRCHGQYVIHKDRIKKIKRTAVNKGVIYTDGCHEVPVGTNFIRDFF